MLALLLKPLLGEATAVPNAPGLPSTDAAWVGRFDLAMAPWQELIVRPDLKPNRFERRSWDGVDALQVHSAASMSLMARPLHLDLAALPVLCWRWRVEASISKADMRVREGDDYAARVYVSFKLPDAAMSFSLKAKLGLARAIWGKELPDAAINYVWDNRQAIGTERPNAYTDRAIMHVLRSGDSQAGHWVEERRNVREDVARLFSKDAQAVQLAVTADTDNTGGLAQAGFADFHFVPASSACQFGPILK
ncbi:DUF3047 domain-containing protein [Roseateles sp.]|uniref:DUF3047 domain-containing protein n=1 Tax=Roseateles sp. TaxID=1971397 RepID=UPI00286B2716|nr:DUF3047 domain-containing protein [Roseateles sp.]